MALSNRSCTYSLPVRYLVALLNRLNTFGNRDWYADGCQWGNTIRPATPITYRTSTAMLSTPRRAYSFDGRKSRPAM